MRPNTPALAAAIRDLVTHDEKVKSLKLQERVDLLKDAYKGEDCWVIATGPSATSIDGDLLKSRLKDRLVVAVKQAYNLLPGVTDFHVVNPCNLATYQYSEPRPVSVAVIWPPGSESWHARWDMSFMIPRCGVMKRSVCWEKNFAPWELANSIDRPWGPGIMHEIGFYLPVHFGCKRIFTLGFDLEVGEGRHFFSESAIPMNRDTVTVPVSATGAVIEWLVGHGIEWYRIASPVNSQMPAPTMTFDDATASPL